ncbi:hypothetical protein NEOLEDRAFT_1107583 [Neolentinus lepideus HHB14362 ss-1]|uniref:Luciferase domain-containing protein n=1 Tax=Neolentinus lepideus HHB14362 ss-1 TaxID=1314782 RepID=A0A165V0N0_9AGAM|nr:hypothetical protein NEOLEDRAFT_1107583 [Neolentinus lepideus HHB14362 ss-1]
MSDISKRATLAAASVRELFARHPRLTILLSSVTTFLGLSYPALARNYQAYKDLGRGALPSNVFGWAVACMLKPFEREGLSTEIYNKDLPESWLGDPETFPFRHGPRAKLGWHFPPQRQVDQIPSDEMKQKIIQAFLQAAVDNIKRVEVAASLAEKAHAAMFVRGPPPHAAAAQNKREIGHVHADVDYSMHLMLAPGDCKLVIEHGWGERHPLGGTQFVPAQLLLLYAPRDEEELAVVQRITKASIGFMTNSREVV